MTILRLPPFSAALTAFLIVASLLFPAAPAQAADRSRVMSFLEVTGFDVALDSIALSASGAPQMLGLEAGDFGVGWARMADQVFDTERMRDLALDILVDPYTQSLSGTRRIVLHQDFDIAARRLESFCLGRQTV